MAQGFYFWRPQPVEAAVQMVRDKGKTTNFESRAEWKDTEIRWLMKEPET